MEVLLLFVLLLAWQQISCFAAAADGGFSVEFIHRDSPRSPFHDPALSPQDRMLAAVRRSLAYGSGSAKPAAAPSSGVVAEIVSGSFEYLMYVNVGTPPRKMLAIADTGSDLIWVNCSKGNGDLHRRSAASMDDGSPPPGTVFDPSQSSTYHVVACHSDECKQPFVGCDTSSNCHYLYSYGDGSETIGLLSTETFNFRGGGSSVQPIGVPNITFGCSEEGTGTLDDVEGLVGLGGGNLSLVSQLGAATSFGRRFSYCLVPYSSNVSSTLNFGAKAVVSDPGAASTPLLAPDSDGSTYYTVGLESVAIGGQTVAQKTSRIIVDSGTTLTYLDSALVQPLRRKLERQIKLPRMKAPEQVLEVCYNVSGRQDSKDWGIPDVTLRFGGGAAVTLHPENTFVLVQEGTLCLAVVPISERRSISILGNVAQQDFHVGYDLDARTVTFAAADCAKSSSSAS